MIRCETSQSQPRDSFTFSELNLDAQTRLSKNVLRQLKIQHSSVMSMSRFYRIFWRYYLLLVVTLGSVAAIFWSVGSDAAALAIVGIIVGVLLRDIYWFRGSLATWPTLDAIVDWDRVDNLLEARKP